MLLILFLHLLQLISADLAIEEFAIQDLDNIEDQEARMAQFGIYLRKPKSSYNFPPAIADDKPSEEQNWYTGKFKLDKTI